MESQLFDLEFSIPFTHSDLLNPDNKRKVYYVEDVLSEDDLGHRIIDAKSKFENEGTIVKEFDTLYSVYCHFEKLDLEVVQTSLEILIKNFSMVHKELNRNLEKSPTCERKKKLRNIFKMNLYLLCIFTEKFETESTKLTADSIVNAKGRGRSKTKPKKKNTEFSWDETKEKIVHTLYEVCQLPLFLLWEPPVVEEEVVNLITSCAYRLLENTNINHNRLLKDYIFNILGQMVAKYNHSLSCSLKILQLVQQYEHLSIPLAHLLELFVKKFSAKTVIGDVIREIVQMNGRNLFNDSTAIRSVTVFLMEIAQQIPSEIINYLSILLPFLEQESYTMRNCILSIITELLLKLLSNEELNVKQKNLRDDLLDSLEDHIHDVNAFVRSRVLQLWSRLVVERAIPLKKQYVLLEFVVGRIKDKSNNVRKNAVHLITELLQTNPFAAKFSAEELQKNYEKELQKLKELEESEKVDVQEEQEISEKETENIHNEEVLSSEPNTEILKQQVVVQYLQDSVKFLDLIGKAIPLIANLLNSRQSADVLAAIDFFVVAYEFGLKESVCGIRKMLILVGSNDASIKETVIESCKRLYLKSNTNHQPLKIVKSLTTLALGATIGELTSLEELMGAFAKSGQLGGAVYQILWERFTLKAAVPNEERKIALVLLGMIAGTEINLVKSNIDVLLAFGFGTDTDLDFQIARETCVVLSKLIDSNKKSCEKPVRYPKDDQIFTRLLQALVSGVTNIKDQFWISFMEKAVMLIYSLGDQPDDICTDLLKKLAAEVLTSKSNENKFGSTPTLLTRLIATAGHIALSQLIYLDCQVFTEIKRRQEMQQKRTEMKNKRKTARKSICATATLTPNKTADKSYGEEELMTGADTDDAEAELIRKILDMETVIGDNLLAAYAPVIVEICGQFNRFTDTELLTASATALIKFMLVSSEFCEDNLQLLVTMMEKSPSNVIRENLVIGIGDLIIRFPNLTAPWSCKLYSRLQDSCVQVRLNTLTVLSHLTFNDMIKAKGQISDVAICIVDENVRIADAAKLFFNELANKGATIYNMLPDIISRLSDPEIGTDEEKFRIILKFLIGLIQKDRQLEGLVEKLCHRFRASDLERQWHNLAYCMSLLSYNQKCLQKLLENFNSFGNKLVDPFVHDCFQTIINNSKKLAKPEMKSVLEELEQKIEAIAAKGVSENNAVEKENKENGNKKTKKKPRRVNKPNKNSVRESEEKRSITPQKRRFNSNRSTKPVGKLVFSSDSDE